MKRLILAVMAALPLMATAQYKSTVWSPDNGDGTYTNPVINADYSDPDVCVGPSGEDYYLTASSFQCVPGLPILHSKDLVNWQIVGHALKSLYTGDEALEQHFAQPRHGEGVWAPSIRYHDGWYYIYWGDPDFGVYMVKTQNPAGEWEKPVCVIRGKGYIDTTPLWDDDGRCYLVNGWANSRAKFASVLTVRELSADGTRAIGQPVIVFDGNGTENRTCEGPKFYKRDGWYWIMCPAGGVPTGFQLAMRSKSPYGPYEAKKVLWQGKTNINGPHQGGWVHTKYGEDWFLHFQDKEAYGRVVHLNPVDWSSGWPMMGRKGEPVTTYKKPKSSSSVIVNPIENDEFDAPVMGKQWQWHANYDEKFGVPTAFGTFRIYTHKLSEGWKNFWEVPNLLLQKTPADQFTVTTKLRFTSKADGQFGGLIMMGLDYSALVVRRMGQAFELVQMTCKGADKGKQQTENVIATLKPTAADKTDYKPGIHEDIHLRLTVNDSKVRFAYSLNGKNFQECGDEFQMKEGKWIGAKFGYIAAETDPKCDRGWVEADWIRVTPNSPVMVAQNKREDDYGYLYCHMSDRGQWTAYAISRDGYNYEDVMGGQPIMDPKEHARIEGGQRDAYICRAADGRGYLMVTTDMNNAMTKALGKQNDWDNYGIDLLRSDDLLHWTSVSFDYRKGTSIFCDPESESVYKDWSTINRVWAPQIFWDPDYMWADGSKGGYMIYYSMWNRAEEKYDRMYYSYTDKSFTKLTQPRLLFDWGYATIDADINYLPSDGLYHMLIKKEGGKPGIYTATSQHLTTGWGEPVEDDYVSFEGTKKCEGSSAFQLIGDKTWRVAYIQYSDRPKHYRICEADENLRNFKNPVDIKGVNGPQHGSFMRLTKQEYKRLKELVKNQ